jgi:hypothetical protein
MEIKTTMPRELVLRFIAEVDYNHELKALVRRKGPKPGLPGAVLKPGIAHPSKAHPQGQTFIAFDGEWYDYRYAIRLVGGMDESAYRASLLKGFTVDDRLEVYD